MKITQFSTDIEALSCLFVCLHICMSEEEHMAVNQKLASVSEKLGYDGRRICLLTYFLINRLWYPGY